MSDTNSFSGKWAIKLKWRERQTDTVARARGGQAQPINKRCACVRACAAGVGGLVVLLYVCVSATILALQATRRLMSDTNSFSGTWAIK